MEEHLRKKLRILLVDDDEEEFILTRALLTDRTYLSTQAEPVGFELHWAATYDTALNAFRKKQYDLYLVDYLLGKKNGLELLKEAIAEDRSVPIIILTGQGNYEVDMEAMRLGAADYLVKNEITPQLLERSIRYAMERAQLLKSLNEKVIRDELTGLLNRREITHRLEEEYNRFQRLGHSIGLILMDVDHFKDVNDTYGHQVGDEVLQRIAKLLIITLRSIDQPARIGGDEFMIVFPQTTAEQAWQVAERMRRLVSAQPFYILRENGRYLRIPVSTSLGVAAIPEDAKTPSQLIGAADKALYLAKQRGKNCAVSLQTI